MAFQRKKCKFLLEKNKKLMAFQRKKCKFLLEKNKKLMASLTPSIFIVLFKIL